MVPSAVNSFELTARLKRCTNRVTVGGKVAERQ